MTELTALIRRNSKMFFKDKGMFFTSLITPIILLILYATFLAKVYKDSFISSLPQGFSVDETLVNGMVGGQLLSSLLAVSCVTVAFCANLLMVQDKSSGVQRDFMITPVKSSTLALGYFLSSTFVTFIVCLVALAAGLIYISCVGWYLSVVDIILIVVDVILLVLFGTALSSLINCNLSTNGQGSAVGTIVSSGYGFICGAYMPISNFGDVLQKVLSFMPGTYGTALLRNHCLRSVCQEMLNQGIPKSIVESFKGAVDCNLYFFGNKVAIPYMYLILLGSIAVITLGYVALYYYKKAKKR